VNQWPQSAPRLDTTGLDTPPTDTLQRALSGPLRWLFPDRCVATLQAVVKGGQCCGLQTVVLGHIEAE